MNDNNQVPAAARLRQYLSSGDMLVAPGVYDGITARLAEQAKFTALYMTGAGTAASYGLPDYGLLTMTEMVANAARIVACTTLPVIADADTGFGNELNVTRAVRAYEQAGVAGIHIEDQVSPKRCGHLDGKELVPAAEFVAKIRAALAARRNPDFVIIARTDANSVSGLDDAIARANAALAAGADLAFVEAPRDLDEIAAIPRRVNGPCLFNIVRGGKTPDISLHDVREMGYRLAILPSLLLASVMRVCEQELAALAATGMPPLAASALSAKERFQRMGSDDWDALRTRFIDKPR
ncbi:MULTISPECIES: isocitrate lyase/PEP mutase family protein [Burkholderiaceae]|uniref:Methylisocitrate lyase n=1 Tax=Caballeronia sordidicola TaxID=196367 RepID=A0A242MTE8_CABSO|nr:isocitrate lyase/PEP mutase family protein [Caballeronia sordidicola]OTP74665.1 Methylisocitrate lyase [Caballeronia sordidicola]